MTLTLELSTEEEAVLKDKAARAGLDPSDYVRGLIEKADIPISTAGRVRAVLGDRAAGTGASNWSEVEAACDPH